MRKTQYTKTGFTLVEILLVTSLIGMTGLAIYNALSNGIKVWEHSRKFYLEEDVNIFFEKISSDLHNMLSYSLIKFSGEETSISFPSRVTTLQNRTSAQEEVDYTRQIGRVEYYFDPGNDTISRRQANYGQAVNDQFGKGRIIAHHISSLKFFYFYTENGENKSGEVVEGIIPEAVNVQIEFLEEDGNKRIMERMIPLYLRA